MWGLCRELSLGKATPLLSALCSVPGPHLRPPTSTLQTLAQDERDVVARMTSNHELNLVRVGSKWPRLGGLRRFEELLGLEGNVTKFSLDKALKLVASGVVTFDERSVVHRVVP